MNYGFEGFIAYKPSEDERYTCVFFCVVSGQQLYQKRGDDQQCRA
jgi:hypothetical protein